MGFKNKMIGAALCAMIAVIGIFGISNSAANVARANTPQATSAVNSASVEQLQQIVNSLIQQIQQLIQLIAQLKPQETCGNGVCRFGETAASCAADCGTISCSNECAASGEGKCAGAGLFQTCGNYDADSCLEWSTLNSCSSGQICAGGKCTDQVAVCGNHYCETGETAAGCPADCTNNTCKTLWWSNNTSKICQQKQFCGNYMYLGLKTYNSQSDCQKALDATCNQECAAKGYALGGSYCVANSQGILESCCCSGSASKCGNNTCDAGENNISCPNDCACAEESETAYTGGKSCCWGLIAVSPNGCSQGSAGCYGNSWVCQKLPACGNNSCETTEDNLNCPQDCALSTTPSFVIAGVTTSSPAAAANNQAALNANFNVLITAKERDVYIPKTGAFVVKAAKNNDANFNNWIQTNAIYAQPAGTAVTSNSYVIAKNTSATFSVQSRYEINSGSGNYALWIFEIKYGTYDGAKTITYQPQKTEKMVSDSQYLQVYAAAVCGNAICDGQETSASCLADCSHGSYCSAFACSGLGATSSINNYTTVASCNGIEKIRVICDNGLLSDLGQISNGYRLCCDAICGNNVCELGETVTNCPADCH